MLDGIGVSYHLNPRLVRGLDYYTRTVFEWITDSTGAQNAVCSGGRYDGLIAQLGGEATPAIGFAMGIERLVALLVAAGRAPAPARPDLYVVVSGTQVAARALQIVEQLRSARPQLRIELNAGGGNFKAQFRRADKSGGGARPDRRRGRTGPRGRGRETFTRAGRSERVSDRGSGERSGSGAGTAAPGRHGAGVRLGEDAWTST